MNEAHEHRHLPWGPFSLAFFGMAFARAWVSLVFVLPGGALPFSALPHIAFDAAYVLAGAAAVVLARRIVPYAERHWSFAATLIGMLIASCAFAMTSVLPPGLRDEVFLVAALTGGAAFLSCSLLNAEALAGTSILRIALYLSGSNLLGSVLVFFLRWVPPVQLAVSVFFLPIIAVVLIRGAWESLPVVDRQKAGYPRRPFPWKLFVLLGLFAFAYGLRSETLVMGAGRHSSFSTALVAGCVFFTAYFFPQHFDVSRLCRAPLPLMLCGISLLPVEGVLGQTASSYLISMGFTLMRLLAGLLIYDMSKRTGMAIVPLVAAHATTQFLVVVGNGLPGLLERFFGEPVEVAVVSIVVCIVLAVSFVLLFSQSDFVGRWGMGVLEAGSLEAEENREVDLLARCAELAKSYHLTPREEEVLREMGHRKGSKEIMRNLVIAEGTLKAHVRHIYEKTGVHTRSELYGLLGQHDRGSDDGV